MVGWADELGRICNVIETYHALEWAGYVFFSVSGFRVERGMMGERGVQTNAIGTLFK